MSEEYRRARRIAYAAAFAALLAVASYVSFALPITDVPFTLQVLVVLLAGLVLGPGLAAISIVLYMVLGAIGVPVFAGGAAGIGVLLGPLGGYIIGWPFAAAIAGAFAKRGLALRLFGAALGIICVYAFGVTGLHVVQGVPWRNAVFAGALPFLPFDALKGVVAALIAPPLRRLAMQQEA
ncbi:MAG: biotin transporter BioY [Thermaerobacter sp.]|nr:biotin transporter BioY [Thermaerobacter sp.]